jgi:LuxR family maltose regulon positive regulatory protein
VPQDSALQRLRMPSSGGERWAREAFVVTVLEAIEGLPGPVRLVFDDVHEIVGHPTERALRALVRHPVQGLTLVLCSRVADPRLRRAVDRIRRMIEERGGSVSLHGRPGGGPGAAVVGRSSKSRLVIIGGFLPGGLSPPPRPVRPDLAE